MTINIKTPKSTIAVSFGLLVGGIVGETTVFINYYFGKYISDSLILLFLAGVSFWIGSVITKKSGKTLFVLSLLSLHLAVGLRYAYELHKINEWVSTGLYVIISLLALLCGIQRDISQSKRPAFLLAALFSFVLVALVGITPAAILITVYSGLTFTQLTHNRSKQLTLYLLTTLPFLTAYLLLIPPATKFERQSKYFDPLVFSEETPFQTVDITSWKGQQWFYYNNINQFSSIDHWLYFEPMAHVAGQVALNKDRVLVIGGENGLLIHQLLKYQDIQLIDIAPIDIDLYEMAKSVTYFSSLNQGALHNKRINYIEDFIFSHLTNHKETYDLIFVDVPDPVDIELNQYYTREFYYLCHEALSQTGIIVTQAGSPYFATKAYNCINFTMQTSNFTTLPVHNQVLTLGEWGWIIGFKDVNRSEINTRIENTEFDQIETKWLNKEAVRMMLAFGKPFEAPDTIVNSLKEPIVQQFYTTGTWKLQ
ncbi:MAG: hypothetical protein AAF519_02515 [Bacteroidota bacterium]